MMQCKQHESKIALETYGFLKEETPLQTLAKSTKATRVFSLDIFLRVSLLICLGLFFG